MKRTELAARAYVSYFMKSGINEKIMSLDLIKDAQEQYNSIEISQEMKNFLKKFEKYPIEENPLSLLLAPFTTNNPECSPYYDKSYPRKMEAYELLEILGDKVENTHLRIQGTRFMFEERDLLHYLSEVMVRYHLGEHKNYDFLKEHNISVGVCSGGYNHGKIIVYMQDQKTNKQTEKIITLEELIKNEGVLGELARDSLKKQCAVCEKLCPKGYEIFVEQSTYSLILRGRNLATSLIFS